MSLQRIDSRDCQEELYKVDPKYGKRVVISKEAHSEETSVEVKLMIQISQIRGNPLNSGFAFETREATTEALDLAISQLMAIKKQVVEQVVEHTGVVPSHSLNRTSSTFRRDQVPATFTARGSSTHAAEKPKLKKKHSHATFGGHEKQNACPPPPSSQNPRRKSGFFGLNLSLGGKRPIKLDERASIQPKAPSPKMTVAFLKDIFLYFYEPKMIDQEGLYRISSNDTDLNHAQEHFRSGARFSQTDVDPFLAANLIKRILREDFELIPYSQYEAVFSEVEISDESRVLEAMHTLYLQLDSPRQELLKALFVHLSRVDAHSKKNKMHAANVAMTFAPAVTRFPSTISDPLGMANASKLMADILEICIKNTDRRAKVHWLDEQGTSSELTKGQSEE